MDVNILCGFIGTRNPPLFHLFNNLLVVRNTYGSSTVSNLGLPARRGRLTHSLEASGKRIPGSAKPRLSAFFWREISLTPQHMFHHHQSKQYNPLSLSPLAMMKT
jgi:hypothetical protein